MHVCTKQNHMDITHTHINKPYPNADTQTPPAAPYASQHTHKCIHRHMHAYIHTCMHTYTHACTQTHRHRKWVLLDGSI